MKVSIIVPVYNKEPYVQECLRNNLSQDFDDFEIVVVDDGSTDNSGYICEEIAQEDPRVKVYHIQNAGVTAARKYGVAHSTGEYILFCDADDYYLPGALQILYQTITTTGTDEVFAAHVNQNGKTFTSPYDGSINSSVVIKHILSNKPNLSLLWGIIYKRSILKGCLEAPREIIEGEDKLMQIQILMSHPRIFFIKEPVYKYYMGVPNQRMQTLERILIYDRILKDVLAAEWNLYKNYFTRFQIQTYKDCLCLPDYKKYLHYYHQEFRNNTNQSFSLADRIITSMPPRIARYTIKAYRWYANRIKSKL